jgi:hypothetical protein
MAGHVLSEEALLVDADDVLARPLETTKHRRGERVRRLPSVRERKRAENRERHHASPERGLALEFRCECVRPDCSARLPLEVERHRRSLNRYIVCLAHADVDTAVGVADRFLIVETHGVTVVPATRPAHPGSRTRPSAT